MSDEFVGTPRDAVLDRAALIVAWVQGRESATRTDYAHPRIKDIVAVLQQAASEAGAKPKRTKS